MRSVLITGCSSGFGLNTAVLLARRGWRVFASMRNLGKRAALDLAAQRAGVPEGSLEVSCLDVTDPASVKECVGRVLERTGGVLDAVVQNAGIGMGGPFEDLPDEEIRRVMETNFFGVLTVTRQVLPAMRARRQGRIVLLSSNSAFSGSPTLSAYCASKWALEGWAESVALEVAPFGVRLALVEPGMYRTSIWENARRYHSRGSPYEELFRQVNDRLEALVARHARDPQEVAETITRVLESRRPRFRNPVGPDARLFALARGLVPFGVRAFAVRRLLGQPA
jgi:NAD(P)-dependent dehydrogenase (short-subunit alcohol dehydrogenase family)